MHGCVRKDELQENLQSIKSEGAFLEVVDISAIARVLPLRNDQRYVAVPVVIYQFIIWIDVPLVLVAVARRIWLVIIRKVWYVIQSVLLT